MDNTLNPTEEIQLRRQLLKDAIEPSYHAWTDAVDSYHSYHMPDDEIKDFEEDLYDTTECLVGILREISPELVMPERFAVARPYLSSVIDELQLLKPFVAGELKQQLSELASLIAQEYCSKVPPARRLSNDEPELHPSLGGSYYSTAVH